MLMLIVVDEKEFVDVEAPEPAEQNVGDPATPVEAAAVCELDCEPRLAVPSPLVPSPPVPRLPIPVLDIPIVGEVGAVEDVIAVVPAGIAGLTAEEFMLGAFVTPEVVVTAMFVALHGLDVVLSPPSELGLKLKPPPSNVGNDKFSEVWEHC